MDENADVLTVPGVGGFVRGGKAYTLPNQAHYQLRYTSIVVCRINIAYFEWGVKPFRRRKRGIPAQKKWRSPN